MRVKLIASAVAAGLLTGTVAGVAVTANAAPVNWQAQTCQAAIAYSQHPSRTGMAKAISDATHYGQALLSRPAVRSYLNADVLDLLATVDSPSRNAPKYVPRGIGYIAQDCLKAVTVG